MMKGKALRKYILLLLIGCGSDTVETPVDGECQPYSENYSHSVTYCGEHTVENIRNVFRVCNPRVQHSERAEGCVSDLMLKVMDDPDCDAVNICWRD